MDENLHKILKKLDDLEERLVRLEEKTDDLHSHIPFVEWLRVVASSVSTRFYWLSGYQPAPKKAQLTNN